MCAQVQAAGSPRDRVSALGTRTWTSNITLIAVMAFSSESRIKEYLLYALLFNFIHGHLSLDISSCNDTWRKPDYGDISVTCGPQNIELNIYLCPIYYDGFNESQIYMNDIFTNSQCQGIIDTSGRVPVLKFIFSVNDSSTCGSSFVITSSPGQGIFQDFSNIQSVNISGIIKSRDPSTGIITYSSALKYLYSCQYPLEYILNNTRLDVIGNSVAINTNNGSFLSTISLKLYSDATYAKELTIPSPGLQMNSSVFVEVRANNLTAKFYVMLDRCYASVSPFPTNSTYYDLFIGCKKDTYTEIIMNGGAQYARFSFRTFRFIEQNGQPISTWYLHCITRLCAVAECARIKPTCLRRRREVRADQSSSSPTSVSEPATVTSPAISTNIDNGKTGSSSSDYSEIDAQGIGNTTVGLGITVGLLALLCLLTAAIACILHGRLKK
ncbi:hypothetical protein XELAEV_18012823mg [Xenopus laevis]|uniref:ZP domain-containing protein n=1 Tax=Xenopus laevis TaxID=8355 RepID=A0A974DNC6_XENLA|nr:hypothetical protein XELAEV_18012823mg [Xenopus laevis]